MHSNMFLFIKNNNTIDFPRNLEITGINGNSILNNLDFVKCMESFHNLSKCSSHKPNWQQIFKNSYIFIDMTFLICYNN